MRKKLADAVRVLAMDAVEKANSGHPGAPMGMADMAEALWRHGFKHNPRNPQWFDRDRFVLSNGHASMLLYAVLHLTGYAVSTDDLRNFRQLGSKTPGHPEHGLTPGVETTTGPLGQGIAAAVGMALAERMLAARFNKPDLPVVDHFTYTFLGDGCMMEGVSHEACSLAGTLGLGKLIALYDSNNISIDGAIDGWFTEDVPARFEAYGWHVLRGVNGHGGVALDEALTAARAVKDKPSLIVCRTHIGYGSPRKADSSKCHGSPLGEEEVTATREALGWENAPFDIPADIAAAWDAREQGAKAEQLWQDIFDRYAALYPQEAAEFTRRMRGQLPSGWQEGMQAIIAKAASLKENSATRVASQKVLEDIMTLLPEMVGGSADLTGSVGTFTKSSHIVSGEHPENNYISYGVREFAMGAMMNGMALHGGILPYAGTFMIFSDYAKNAIRLSALMDLRVVWVLTHDSIGVGEDGPTHQPVEQVAGLRLIPHVHLWRPCDSVECALAWKSAIGYAGPSCMSLSRQTLPFVERSEAQIAQIERGGYVLRDCPHAAAAPDAIIMATGSEITLALQAAEILHAKGRRVRVVSMPCTAVFDAQDAAYKESVLPAAVRARVAVEAASADYWYKYTGLDGAIVGMTSFGASAPGKVLAEHFGFTVDNVVKHVESVLG